MKQFCAQMQTRDAPLRSLRQGRPSSGASMQPSARRRSSRAATGSSSSPDTATLGRISRRSWTFTMSGGVDYNADFQMSGSTMYIYFRPRAGDVEQLRIARHRAAGRAIPELPLEPGEHVRDPARERAAPGRLHGHPRLGTGGPIFRSGSSTSASVRSTPYDVHGSDRVTWENPRVEVQWQTSAPTSQGLIEVTDSGRAIYVTGQVDGVPASRTFSS